MLFHITNKCNLNCAHCMQDANMEGEFMSDVVISCCESFLSLLGSHYNPVIIISGGEPTYHPKFEELVRRFRKASKGSAITICSNGMWLFDERRYMVERVLRSSADIYMQISHHKSFYTSHDAIQNSKGAFRKISRRITFADDQDSPISIKDLGRANNLPDSMLYNGYPDCLSFGIEAFQRGFFEAITIRAMRGKFCTPMIDYEGNIHYGESILCKSYGNITCLEGPGSINDGLKMLAEEARTFSPCGKCRQCKKLHSADPQAATVRRILNID